MTKKIKTVLLLCLTLCAAVFALAFASCGETSDVPEGYYRITVVYDDGTPVTDVDVQLCIVNEDGSIGMCLSHIPTVDKNGVADVRVSDDSRIYHIQLNGLPDGQEYSDVNTTAGVREYTVTVTK